MATNPHTKRLFKRVNQQAVLSAAIKHESILGTIVFIKDCPGCGKTHVKIQNEN